MSRKHAHNFAPPDEDNTHEAEISVAEAPASKAPRILDSLTGQNDEPPKLEKRQTEAEARRIWRAASAVCFDVDSTVCTDEAIDGLAEFCGVGEAVAEWTRKAMNGNYSFRQALCARLDLIKPTRLQIKEYNRQHPPSLTPGIEELVAELKRRGVAVYLVSGGFTRMILEVGRLLDVPEENIYANVLHFTEDGAYEGFDESQPTSDSMGKAEVVRMLKSKDRHPSLVVVGDGATDMEAAPPADAFIGFGGNQIRQKVKEEAPWFVLGFQELLDELN